MKIIAGKFRGRNLKSPKGLSTRPVLAMIREALFNVIGRVDGLKVLDLFAGTGAVGIEALSRGAGSLISVDSGFEQCAVIKENLNSFNASDFSVLKLDAFRSIEKFGSEGMKFDFIFADPPYHKGLGVKAVELVFSKEILSEYGVMAVTVGDKDDIPEENDIFEKAFDRRYGNTRLLIYRLRCNDSEEENPK